MRMQFLSIDSGPLTLPDRPTLPDGDWRGQILLHTAILYITQLQRDPVYSYHRFAANSVVYTHLCLVNLAYGRYSRLIYLKV